jgi:hypothetical protein
MDKLIKVKCAGWEMEVSVDTDNFDDIFIEACTRALEKNIRESKMIVAPFMEANIKKTKTVYIFNSYKILANAGFYTFAENLRRNVKREMKVDLRNEPMKG